MVDRPFDSTPTQDTKRQLILTRFELPDKTVHVWWASLSQIDTADDLNGCLSVLSAREHARFARFVFTKDKRCYALSHALLRSVLSLYAPVSPGTWALEENTHGKPHIVEPAECSDLQFNLSHTPGMAGIAVARRIPVGVDVEFMERGVEPASIAENFFSPMEAQVVRSLSGRDQVEAFFRTWTLKESYIKARGLGLSIPLDSFSFDLSGSFPFLRHCDSRSEDESPACWQFQEFQPLPNYRLALAVRSEPRTCEIVCREASRPLL